MRWMRAVAGATVILGALCIAAFPGHPQQPYGADGHTRLLLHLDEKEGRRAHDTGPHQNHGALEGGAAWNENGRFGGCAAFDGEWDAVRCGADRSLSPPDRITFEAWVKPKWVDGTRQVLSKDIRQAPWYQYHLQIRDGLVIAGVTFANRRHLSVTSDRPIEADRWTHLAGVYDGAALRLVIDGRPQSNVAEGTGTLIDSRESLNIGAWSSSYWYEGLIDEVRVSATVRSVGQPDDALSDDREAAVIVPMARVSPTIDGVLSPGEWDDAPRLTGFRRNTDGVLTSRPQPTVNLTFDEQSLYVGFACPSTEPLKRDAQGHTAEASRDDAIEVFLDPFRTKTSHWQFIAAAGGAFFEVRNGDQEWTGNWTYETRIEGYRWTGEIAIPFADLGVGTPYDGVEWGLNVCRDYKNPIEWTSLAGAIGAFAQPQAFMPAVFTGGPTEVAVSSASLRLETRVIGTERKRIEATVDCSAIPPAQRRAVTATVALMDTDGKAVLPAAEAAFTGAKGKAELDVSALPTGTYSVVATLHGPDKRPLASQSDGFVKPDSTPWLGNQIGVDESVPPPWTPVRTDGRSVRCWNRVYTFGTGPLPTGIRIGTASVLSSPIRLVAVVDGQSVEWEGGPPRVRESRADKVVLDVANASADLDLEARVTVEFDGMARVDLRLLPKRPCRLDGLSLVVPLAARYATLHYIIKHPGGGFYDPNILGSTPEEWHGPFSPYVWLGNEALGLVWFTESARNWRVAESDRAVEIARDGDAVRLRVNMVDHAILLEEPLSLTFGLQATPVKPVPPDWQDVRMACWPEFEPNILIEWAHPWVVKWFAFPEIADPDQMKYGSYAERVARAREAGARFVQYVNVNKASAGLPEYRYYEAEWAAGSGDMGTGDVAAFGHALMAVCPTTTWSDFFVHSLKRFLDEHDINGLYADNAVVFRCTNTSHGCARAPVGPDDGTYPVFATRELQKRIYKLVKSMDPSFLLIAHTAGELRLPFISFFDVYVEGERFMSIGRTHNGDYMARVPLDQFRAEFVGRNWGLAPVILAELKGCIAEPKQTETLMALARIHGTSVWPGMSTSQQQVVTDLWRAERAFGMAGVTFYPYWRNSGLVRTSSDEIKASIYAKAGKALLYVANTGEADADAAVHLDLAALSLRAAHLRAEDVYAGLPVRLEASTIHLRVPGKGFRAIVLSK